MRQMLPLHSFAALSFTARPFPARSLIRHSSTLFAIVAVFLLSSGNLVAQGVTSGGIDGVVTNAAASPLVGASVTAVHVPSGTTYRTVTRTGGVLLPVQPDIEQFQPRAASRSQPSRILANAPAHVLVS